MATADTSKDTEAEYSEIVELPTIRTKSRELTLRPSTLEETQLGTYITMGPGDSRRPSRDPIDRRCRPSRDRSTVSRPRTLAPDTRFQDHDQECSFRRFSTIEESAREVVYENLGFRLSRYDDFVLPDDTLPRGRERNDDGQDLDEQDDLLSLRTRLKRRKARMCFIEYACYAIDAVVEEVENIIYLELAFLILSLAIMFLGFKGVASCTVSPKLPVLMAVSGFIDSVTNVIIIVCIRFKRRVCENFLRDTARTSRFLMFFVHLFGLGVVYSILPPEEEDIYSFDFCDSSLFWTAFAFFHITILTTLTLLIGILITAVCYYI